VSRKRYKPEKIVNLIRKMEVEIANGKEPAQAARRLGSQEVIETLADVMLVRGIPEHLRSDNGPGFLGRALEDYLPML
jgi:hypothetical protein